MTKNLKLVVILLASIVSINMNAQKKAPVKNQPLKAQHPNQPNKKQWIGLLEK